MILKDFLVGIYGMNKANTQPSYHVYKFAERNGLELGRELTKQELCDLAVKFSSLDKREKAMSIIHTIVEVVERAIVKLDILRKESYKRVCKVFHPDTTETGSEESFKFIQDIKEYFWDYKGQPRESIVRLDWAKEKKFKESSSYGKGSMANGGW
ncbi:MAG: hypothetical protein ACRCZ0_02335 [Cetobacterium sp.]